MDATQMINDSILESDEEDKEEENENKRGQPMAKLCILKNKHITESELPLFLGDNILGRDPGICTVHLPSPSISKQHATISISVLRRRGCLSEADMEALIWDLGSMNGTRKGHFKLTPNVRYALSESDSLMVADIPCQFFICATQTQTPEHLKTPLSRTSGMKSKLLNAPCEKGSDISTGSENYTYGSTETRDATLDVEDTSKTPVRTSCLTFEQTPIQPEGTLVPESDSESCANREKRGGRRCRNEVCECDSYKSSPTCSTFLSPSNIIVPESEDESPISTNVGRHRHVSFSKDEPEKDVRRLQLREKKTLANMDDSEGEEGKEEDSAAPGGRMSTESGQDQSVTPAVPVTLSTHQQADLPSDIPKFHMDSDTDIDEDDDASDKVPKSVPSLDETSSNIKPPHVITVIQSEAIAMDSDTDVDEDAEKENGTIHRGSREDETPSRLDIKSALPEAASVMPHSLHLDSITDDEIISVPCQITHSADSALSKQQKDFHLDSDTDVDEEEEKFGTITMCAKKDETPLSFSIEPTERDSAPAASHSLHSDNYIDDKAIPAPGIREAPVLSAVTESCTAAETGTELDILSDSDTDAEDEVIPGAVTTPAFSPVTAPAALLAGSDADTDVDESTRLSLEDRVDLADRHVDSHTDAAVEEVDFCRPRQDQIPNLCRENTPGMLVPLLQNCSTPVQLSDNQEDEDWIVAETQSFVLQTSDCRGDAPVDHTMDSTQAFCIESSIDEEVDQANGGGSFQLGLSDSSHMQSQAHVVATESTQTYVSAQNTQQYAAISTDDRTASENHFSLEATQVYEENEGQFCCLVTSEKENQVDLAQEATQAYISEPYCGSDDETNKDETTEIATAETQLLDIATSSTLAFAETQPMSAFEEGDGLEVENPVSSIQVQFSLQNQIKNTEDHVEATRRPLQIDIAETQLMSGNEEGDQEDTTPGTWKNKEEETQTLTNSALPAVEAQSTDMGKPAESDEEDLIQSRSKRKAKPLQPEENETQTQGNVDVTAVETQPMDTSEHGESDKEDSFPGPRKRKAKQLHFEDEQTQSLMRSEVSVVVGKDRKCDDEESIPSLRKRKAKALQTREEEKPLTHSEAAAETIEIKKCQQPQKGSEGESEDGTSGITTRGKRATRSQLKEKEERAKCSEPSKRQTKNKVLSVSKSRSDESARDGVEEIVQTKQVRGKRTLTKQKDDEEEEDKEPNRHNQGENVSLMKEEGRLQSGEDFTEQMEKEKREGNEREREQEENHCQIEEQEKLERERKEEEEKVRKQLENEDLEQERANERKDQEHQRKHETEANEMQDSGNLETEKQRETKENQREAQEEKMEEESTSKGPVRSRRTTRRTIAEQASTLSTNDDVPARRTRSRSNSSNSVNSERSASSVQDSRGRGRGRGAKTTSEPPQTAIARRSNRRKTVATEAEEQNSNDSLQGLPLRSDSNNSLSADISSSGAQSRGRGGKHNARGRKSEACSIPPIASEKDQNPAPKPTARSRVSRKTEESSRKDPPEQPEDKAESQQARTTRGRWQGKRNDGEPEAEEKSSNLEGGCSREESCLPKGNVSARGQKAVKHEAVAAPVMLAVHDEDDSKEKRKGRKRELEANVDEASTSHSKISKPQEKAQAAHAAEDDGKGEAEDVIPVQGQRRGRTSSAQGKKLAKNSQTAVQVKEEKVTIEEVIVEKRGRCRQPSVVEEKQTEHPQTPSSSGSRKRQAPVESSPVAKTRRSSSASPAASGRLQTARQTYKVLFTGVVDEEGEKVLAHLGGSMAKGVEDMNCLVTDKVRRTVKFLCAVAKGVPIVTTNWLEKSGKAGSFLSPDAFIVKDPEQERKFNFCLQESLRTASSQPLLQGYQIHVTKSVKPEPPHMKDILTCSGATFLSKMPTSNKGSCSRNLTFRRTGSLPSQSTCNLQ
ncbi:mediator of DNA damage checkpoint protein 1 isoform X2 [Antennarius striatus]|uniref:mediator of DNA damage checkpoint protein 1 isoform X2 n=1 Tax=Antennarius striatus TaxID=241820 RepID=UPI0035B2C8AE